MKIVYYIIIFWKRNHYSFEGNGWNSSIFILYILPYLHFSFHEKKDNERFQKYFYCNIKKQQVIQNQGKKNHDAILRAESLAATRVLWLSLKGATGKGAHCARAWWACQKFGLCHQLRGERNNIVWECKACYFTLRQRTYFFQKWNYFVFVNTNFIFCAGIFFLGGIFDLLFTLVWRRDYVAPYSQMGAPKHPRNGKKFFQLTQKLYISHTIYVNWDINTH